MQLLPYLGYCKKCCDEHKGVYIFLKLIYYFWLPWVLVGVQGLSLVWASRGHSSVGHGLRIVEASIVQHWLQALRRG